MRNVTYVLYARKSTEGDKKQIQSIPAQLREMRSRVKKSNLKLLPKPITDEGSAKIPNNREGFNEMVRKIKQGHINGIVTYHINRLSRNPEEAGIIMQLLQDGKIQSIYTASKEYLPDDNALYLALETSMANQSSRELSIIVKRGIQEAAIRGETFGGTPQGYMNSYGRKKIILPDPVRFELIKKAFHLVLDGHTAQEVRKALNDQWKYTSHRTGKPISYAGIYDILSNIRYAGRVPDPFQPGKDYLAAFKPMISLDEFDRVQKLLGKRGKPRLTRTNKYFALRGALKCGECGCMITAQAKKKKLVDGSVREYTYYGCTRKKPCNQKKSIREEDLFDQTNALLSQYLLSPDLYDFGMKALVEIGKQEINDRSYIQSSQNASESLVQKQLDKLLDMEINGRLPEGAFDTKSKNLRNELASIQNARQEAMDRTRNWYELVATTLETLTNIDKKFKHGDINEKKRILSAIGKNPKLLGGRLAVEPHEWLKPIRNALNEMSEQKNPVRTESLLMDETGNKPQLIAWYTRYDSNVRPSVPKTDALIH